MKVLKYCDTYIKIELFLPMGNKKEIKTYAEVNLQVLFYSCNPDSPNSHTSISCLINDLTLQIE